MHGLTTWQTTRVLIKYMDGRHVPSTRVPTVAGGTQSKLVACPAPNLDVADLRKGDELKCRLSAASKFTSGTISRRRLESPGWFDVKFENGASRRVKCLLSQEGSTWQRGKPTARELASSSATGGTTDCRGRDGSRVQVPVKAAWPRPIPFASFCVAFGQDWSYDTGFV